MYQKVFVLDQQQDQDSSLHPLSEQLTPFLLNEHLSLRSRELPSPKFSIYLYLVTVTN